jgi:hypothetical protein
MSRLLALTPLGWFAPLLLLPSCGGAQPASVPPAGGETLAAPSADAAVTEKQADEDSAPSQGGLGISNETLGDGPVLALTESEIVVGDERAPLSHEAKERSFPLVRTRLPLALGLPPREGDKLRFASDDVRPFEFRLERGVRGAELMSALLSAGFEGLPLSRVHDTGVYLYVLSPTPPNVEPLHASRMRWPERALLVKLRKDGLQFLRVDARSEGSAAPPEEVARLDPSASLEDISATLSEICAASAPCSPFGINPGPESTAALFLDLLAAMEARSEFASPSSPPPRALLLVGEPERIPLRVARQRVGETAVNGRLPAETIRKVVRANFGEFRKCYEAGLSNNPKLEGEVRMRFVIARTGKVSATGVAPESTMPDESVSACVQEAFSKLVFPEPEGGIVTVTYPIRFLPD